VIVWGHDHLDLGGDLEATIAGGRMQVPYVCVGVVTRELGNGE